MEQGLRIGRTAVHARGAGLARFAIAAALVGGMTLTGVTALAPSALAARSPTEGAPCPPPVAPFLTGLNTAVGALLISATSPASSQPNAGCGPFTYHVFGSTPGSGATMLPSTVTVQPDGTLLIDVSSFSCGAPLSLYVADSNIIGASPPSNILTFTPPCVLGVSPPPSLQACSGLTGNSGFLCAAFTDILGRAPDPSGIATFGALLSSGGSRTQAAWGLLTSPEYRGDLVQAWYGRYLDRPADPGGLSSWSAQLAGGWSDEKVIAALIGSPEFFANSGGTDAGFLGALYLDLLGRSVDPSGSATFTALLSAGTPSTQVAWDVLTSPEYRGNLVESYYQYFLGGPSDPAGKAFWVSQLGAGATDEQVISGFVGSDQYFAAVTGG